MSNLDWTKVDWSRIVKVKGSPQANDMRVVGYLNHWDQDHMWLEDVETGEVVKYPADANLARVSCRCVECNRLH